MDRRSDFHLLSQPLCVAAALSAEVKRGAPEDRPALERFPDQTVFAVFETLPNQLEVFLGLVTAEQVAANPDRVLGDLLLKPPPPPVAPNTPIEVAMRRLEVERVGALPVAALKIDRSFVQEMTEDEGDLAVVSGVIALAKSLKLKVIAEGVETPAQYEKLKALGCDFMQGYLFGKPAPLEELTLPFFPNPS